MVKMPTHSQQNHEAQRLGKTSLYQRRVHLSQRFCQDSPVQPLVCSLVSESRAPGLSRPLRRVKECTCLILFKRQWCYPK